MSKIDSEYVMLQQPDHFLSGLTLHGSLTKDKQIIVSSGRNLRSSTNNVSKKVASSSRGIERPVISLVRKSKGGRKKAPPKKITKVDRNNPKETETESSPTKSKEENESEKPASPHLEFTCEEEEDEAIDNEDDVEESVVDNTYCQMCDIKFLSTDLLQEHVEGEDFTCRRCTTGFQTHSQLESHFFTHPTYKCHLCKKQFYVRKDLETHKENSPSCNSSLECKFCDKKFWRQRSLTVHIHYHHKSQDVDYKCTVCSKSFKVREQLQYHLKIVHMAYEHLECRICHKLLLGPLKMKHHMKMVHIKDQELQYTFSCQVCSKVFKNELTLKKHQEIHENPILCEICGKSYHCRTTLLSHIKNEHTKVGTFICAPCNKSFTSEVKYNYHLKKAKAHTNREAVPHFCEVCGKTLLSSNALKRHMIIHTGEKPYKCTICGAAFNQKSSLATHDRVHTSSFDKFRCNDCGMSFKWKQTFANHPKKCKRGQGSGEMDELPDELETSNRFINTFTGFRVV